MVYEALIASKSLKFKYLDSSELEKESYSL
jgi:hypothetical protein